MKGFVRQKKLDLFFKKNNYKKIVAFQTRNPIHKAHVAVIEKCLSEVGDNAVLFLHPVVGPTQSEDIRPSVRIKCYEAVIPYLNKWPLYLSYLPLTMRMAGPKEALLHAIIRKNYGATHFIIGRDHAGPSSRDVKNNPFYAPYAAQKLVKLYEKELGIKILQSKEMVYAAESESYISQDQLADHQTTFQISGTEIRKKMEASLPLPHWFSFPEVEQILSTYYSHKNGLCIYLTGLPCSGKSSIASELKRQIEQADPCTREVIILDGDVMRSYLAKELGFSKADRSINVQRIGYVASLLVKNGGICICPNIAPYEEDRKANRDLISSQGLYFEIFVDTPLEICENRDLKGLYKLAKKGIIKEFTGISAPYEIPTNPELVIDGTQNLSLLTEIILKKISTIYPPFLKFDNQISEKSQTSSFISKDLTDQLLVIGCGRSGTNYLAKFLEESGYAIHHERPGNNGCVSWPMAVQFYSPWKQAPAKKFKHIFHQVRHPLDVISSWVTNLSDLTRDEWVFIRNHIPEIHLNDSLLVSCAKYWYYWNLLAEKKAEWRFQIEEFPQIIHEFSTYSGLTLKPELLKKIPTNFNSWKQIDKKITWDDLKKELPDDLYQKITEMSARYGYKN